ncbi:MAG: hypothetical protein R3C56_32065 [Pirellulaceae bacterium]
MSATTDAGEIPLGLPEEFAVLRSIPTDKRSPESLATLIDYWKASDSKRGELAQAVATAKKPLDPDAELTKLQALIASLEKETPDDAKLPIAIERDRQRHAV